MTDSEVEANGEMENLLPNLCTPAVREGGRPTGGGNERAGYRVTHLLAEKVMLTSIPSQDSLGMSRN